MLLAKTLRSSTFKQALLAILVFGAFMIALLGYVYFSTASFIRTQSDRFIAAEYAILQKAYESGGRDGLIALIKQRVANRPIKGGIYLLADPSFVPMAGYLKIWPSTLQGSEGWNTFSAPMSQPDTPIQPLFRATFETFPDGTHLLVGQEIDDINKFAEGIKAALMWVGVLIFVLAGRSDGSKRLTQPAEPLWKMALTDASRCAERMTNGIKSRKASI